MSRPRPARSGWLTGLLLASALGASGCQRPTHAVVDAAFGIAECDSYFQQALACVERRPAEIRPRLQAELARTRAAWLPASQADGGSREDLRSACRTALDALVQNADCR